MKRRDFLNIVGLAPIAAGTVGTSLASARSAAPALRLGIAGLSHDHVHGILGRKKTGDIEIVGIAESNKGLIARHAQRYRFSPDIVSDSVDAMIQKAKPEAVVDFNSIFDHLKTVEVCAPKGIHVMVEKPLAVSVDHASKIKTLAERHKIHVLTNYETTWYGTHERAWKYAKDENKIGALTKIAFHTGHQGPREIGCSKEFLDWLTDPVLNGAGALVDFGCYGSNLSTWFMEGQKPASVSCFTRRLKPDVYPEVDDDCTIILNYSKAQAVIEASWNWPFSVKDTKLFGQTGYIFCRDPKRLYYRLPKMDNQVEEIIESRKAPYDDPFSFFAAVIQKRIALPAFDLSSLENNLIVVNILEAAKQSAKTGAVVKL